MRKEIGTMMYQFLLEQTEYDYLKLTTAMQWLDEAGQTVFNFLESDTLKDLELTNTPNNILYNVAIHNIGELEWQCLDYNNEKLNDYFKTLEVKGSMANVVSTDKNTDFAKLVAEIAYADGKKDFYLPPALKWVLGRLGVYYDAESIFNDLIG